MSILNRLGILRAAARGFGFRPTGRNGVPAHRGGFRLRGGRTRRGKSTVFPFLPIILFPSGAVDRGSAKRLPPTCCCDRHGLGATPEGWRFPFLLLFEAGRQKLGRDAPLRASARPYLRQQMPQLFGQTFDCLLPLKGKGVIRKRGENLVSPLLCACRAQRHASRRPQAAEPPARLERAHCFALSGEKKHRLMRCFYFSFSGFGSAPGCGRRGE